MMVSYLKFAVYLFLIRCYKYKRLSGKGEKNVIVNLNLIQIDDNSPL